MVVVLGTRSLRKGRWDPVQCGMEVSTESQGQGEGALKGWRGRGQEMQFPAEGRDSQERWAEAAWRSGSVSMEG